jgi:hypothetical protein
LSFGDSCHISVLCTPLRLTALTSSSQTSTRWPFAWMVPSKLAKFYEKDALEDGREEEPPKKWRCFESKKTPKRWVRSDDNLKLSVV